MFSKQNLVFTYHGLHNRELTDPILIKLFRNNISEKAFLEQLEILKRKVKKNDGNNGNNDLIYRDLFFNELRIKLTFDDGYKNNLKAFEMVYEIFGTVPLTIFLTTNLVGAIKQSLWTINLSLLILRGEFSANKLSYGEQVFYLNDYQSRLKCFDIIRNNLKTMNAGDRQYVYDLILSQANRGELERLMFEYSEFQMLTLDEIKQMQSMGVRFEPHGHNHELLHSGQSLEIIKNEILSSKDFIEKNLNQRCQFFAYPNGDYCESAITTLKESGFDGAYTTQVGIAPNLIYNFEIPRVTPNLKPQKFKKQLRGKLF